MSQIEQTDFLQHFARDVKEGLSSQPKFLLAKYFYDETGSALFEQITQQPEYYPTRTEAAILRIHAPDIRDALDGDISLVELGSGSSNKTTILLKTILEQQDKLHYLPIDISPQILNDSAERLESRFGGLATIPIASDFSTGLHKANDVISEKDHVPDRKLVLFLGSSIGNFAPRDARSFLQMIRKKMIDGDGLLLGFDLQKDRDVLNAAYNDRAGVTAQFNLNILVRINRELGGTFDVERFSHRAFYNEADSRIEMHLVSLQGQEVAIKRLGDSFHLEEDETIHTESSYKYTLDSIEDYAKTNGFETEHIFTDERKWFAVALLTPV